MANTNKQEILEQDYALLHARNRKLKREHQELESRYLALLERQEKAALILTGAIELKEEQDK